MATREERVKAAEKALEEYQKQFKTKNVFIYSKRPILDVPIISTGIPELDAATGIGGFACGKMVEISGPESSGKSYTAYKVIASCQQHTGLPSLVDLEASYDDIWGSFNGVDGDLMAYSMSEVNAEANLNEIRNMCRSGKYRLVVVDSVARLTPKELLEGEIGDSTTRAPVATLMSKALPGIMDAAEKSKTAIIWLNQLREKPGMSFGNPEYTPGGRALKFYCHMRISLKFGGQIKGEIEGKEIRVGQTAKFTIVKNKLAPPFRKGKFDIIFDKRWGNPIYQLVCLATTRDVGVFYKRNGWNSTVLTEEKIQTGIETKSDLSRWLFENGLVMRTVEAVKTKLSESTSVIPAFIAKIDDETTPPPFEESEFDVNDDEVQKEAAAEDDE